MRPARRSVLPGFSRWHLAAGFSVALVLIPQSMAYADLAGMPAHFGLYAAALPPIAAAFFVSSPYLQTGPGAMSSLLTFGALSVLAVPGTASYVQLAAVLAIVVGVVRVAFGWMRWGWVAYLMSQPVLTGFASGAAILIIASQVPTAVGVDGFEGGILRRAVVVALHPGVWEPAALGLSLVTLLLVLAGRRLHPVFPGVLVAVVVGLLFTGATLAMVATACGGDGAEEETTTTTAADGGGQTASEGVYAEVVARGVLNCGVNSEVFGFGSIDADGNFAGFDIDY